ncbi:MAG: 30S ribosomal protein S16 [Candidatus Nanopelagicales bacterium]
MAVKIKLKRMGKMRNAQYRIVVADARTKRDGRAIEEIGIYQPKEEPSLIRVDSDRAQYWLGVGAQPTEAVAAILKITGDWQKFKGLPGQEGTLRVAEPKADKLAIFEAAAKDAANEPAKEATTPKKKAAAKAEEPVEAVEVVEVAEAADGTTVVDDVVAEVEADGTVEVVEVVEVVDADGTVEAAEVVAEEIPAETTEA